MPGRSNEINVDQIIKTFLDPSLENLKELSLTNSISTACNRICRGKLDLSFKTWQTTKSIFNENVFSDNQNSWNLNLQNTIKYLHCEMPEELLCLGVFLLNSFIQTNWTGPELSWDSSKIVLENGNTDISKWALDQLALDGEEAYVLLKEPLLLVIAKAIFHCDFSENPLLNIWLKWRVGFLHQRVLDNSSSSLKLMLEQYVSMVKERFSANYESPKLMSRCFLELGNICHYYKLDSLALQLFQMAQETSKFSFNLTGEYGVRTKYQQHVVPQMMVAARSDPQLIGSPLANKELKPKTVALNDDTLLETVQIKTVTDTSDAFKQNLWPIDQCILLANCLNLKNMNPDHGLTKEQMRPFIERVLEHANNWSIHSMALLLRSRLEKEKTRTVERSLFQVQALVDQIPLTDTQDGSARSASAERAEFFFCLALPSRWELDRELGERFMSLGAAASALALFEKLQMWDMVVTCYIVMEQTDQAKAILEQQLQLYPQSASLLTTYGDLTKDKAMLERAWSVNKDRKFPRAMRCLGALYFKEGNYAKAAECYKSALAINPLFENAWFVYGCACIRSEQWEEAVSAFQKCTQLDFENSEAWNNLASVYLHLGQHQNAFHALAQAIRVNFDNERIWQNYLHVAVSAGDWAETMRAMEHIVSLKYPKLQESRKEAAVDLKILDLLVSVAIGGESSAASLVVQKPNLRLLASFLASLTQQIATSSHIFLQASRVFWFSKDYAPAIEYAEKAFRVALNRIGTIPDRAAFELLVKVAEHTVRLYDLARTQLELDGTDWEYQKKSLLRSFKSRCIDQYESDDLYEKVLSM